MYNETAGAEFCALTMDELQAVNGGDAAFANFLGFMVGYTIGCVKLAVTTGLAVVGL